MVFTPEELHLIGLDADSALSQQGIEYQVYSFSGFRADSTISWGNGSVSLKTTLRKTFGIEFYPGSFNVRLKTGIPWIPPNSLNKKKVRLGVFNKSYVLPVILEEKCIGIVSAINVRGFDYTTSERILPPIILGEQVEMYQIYSPVSIRERLNHFEDEDNRTPINVCLLSGDLLQFKNNKN